VFIFTAKINRKKAAAGVLSLLVLLAGVWGLTQAVGGGAASAMAAADQKVKSNEDRLAYLAALGWEVKEEPLSTEELTIPKEFDDSYADYLALQSGQGFDLTKYRGKRVKRYTYEITNYPSGESGVQVSLLVYRSAVVGGEVFTTSLDGFMHGLAMPT
jgi:hypothetical protein